jgi:hypothetical protein
MQQGHRPAHKVARCKKLLSELLKSLAVLVFFSKFSPLTQISVRIRNDLEEIDTVLNTVGQ